MTVARKVLAAVYPVLGGGAAAVVVRGVLEGARRFVTGGSETPSGREGGTAWGWTALSWTVAAGAGLVAGRKLVRSSGAAPRAALQPAQSKQ